MNVGEQDVNGTLILLDSDGDGICNSEEVSCTDNGLAINGLIKLILMVVLRQSIIILMQLMMMSHVSLRF